MPLRPSHPPAWASSVRHRRVLALVMLGVLALGWRYPLLGFIVPVAMLAGMIGGALRGRYVCGNLCPRGSFFDTLFAHFGGRREIPAALFGLPLRWGLFTLLMGFMVWRLARDPGSLAHWGTVFWQMCLLTTGAAVVLGLMFRPRTWCAVCPVGTFGHATGGGKRQLVVATDCRSCGRCEQSCPMGHAILPAAGPGVTINHDCLQCSSCVRACPLAALSLEKPGRCPAPPPPPAEFELPKAA